VVQQRHLRLLHLHRPVRAVHNTALLAAARGTRPHTGLQLGVGLAVIRLSIALAVIALALALRQGKVHLLLGVYATQLQKKKQEISS
jgi:hypothetical protein